MTPAKETLELGQKMQDGSIYAGRTVSGFIQQIFAMPTDLSATMTFNEAAEAVEKLNAENALGHNDWQIPSLDSLRILQKNQNEGYLKGTFATASSGVCDWYWSSKQASSLFGPSLPFKVDICFSDGRKLWNPEYNTLSCRPVRMVLA